MVIMMTWHKKCATVQKRLLKFKWTPSMRMKEEKDGRDKEIYFMLSP
jgi:hypothetical protein